MSRPLRPYPFVWGKAAQIAEQIGMADSTFRDLVKSGRLPKGVLIGGNRLWRLEDVDNALADLNSPDLNSDPIMELIEGSGHGKGAQAHG